MHSCQLSSVLFLSSAQPHMMNPVSLRPRTCHPAALDLRTGVNHVKGPIRQVEMLILGADK